jgi:Tfp pilus assembly protein PilF
MITLRAPALWPSSKLTFQLLLLALSYGLLPAQIGAVGLGESTSSLPLLSVSFQQPGPKSKIELELEKKNATNKKPEPAKRSRMETRSERANPRSHSLNESTITILSEVPGTEISVDGTVVGKIDDAKKLTVKLKKGQHKATASLKGYNPQTITISVSADHSTHTISLGKPLPVPVPAPTPVVKAAPVTVAPPAPPAPTADDIIRRFINPKETNKVTSQDWKEVIGQSEETLKKEPANAQVIGRFHMARGQVSYLNHNFPESLSDFNRSIAVLPDSGIAYFGLGNAYMATNQPLQALKAYQRATELTPELAALAQKGIGDALTKLARANEANVYYKRARDLGYLSSELNKNLAVNLIEDKQWQKALAELSAIEDGDSSAEIQLYLGECYENLKRPLSAHRAYAAASKLDPNSPLAFSKLGNLLYELNEFPEAKEAYERALALDTTGTVINRPLIRKLADKAALLEK